MNCLLCSKSIESYQPTDLLNGHECHAWCFGDWCRDQEEARWASGETHD